MALLLSLFVRAPAGRCLLGVRPAVRRPRGWLGDARRLLQLGEAARQRLGAPRLSGTVRLGVVEEVAGGSLPSALGRFAALHRGVKLEVQIGVRAS
jgi:DNA-binding transcriptional LysR family regulator